MRIKTIKGNWLLKYDAGQYYDVVQIKRDYYGCLRNGSIFYIDKDDCVDIVELRKQKLNRIVYDSQNN